MKQSTRQATTRVQPCATGYSILEPFRRWRNRLVVLNIPISANKHFTSCKIHISIIIHAYPYMFTANGTKHCTVRPETFAHAIVSAFTCPCETFVRTTNSLRNALQQLFANITCCHANPTHHQLLCWVVVASGCTHVYIYIFRVLQWGPLFRSVTPSPSDGVSGLAQAFLLYNMPFLKRYQFVNVNKYRVFSSLLYLSSCTLAPVPYVLYLSSCTMSPVPLLLHLSSSILALGP